MDKLVSLKSFLYERLTAATEEIFGAVEKTIAEYGEEISRSKDLEISRLRLQVKLLNSDPRADGCLGAQQQQQQHTHHHLHHHPPLQQQHLQSVPAMEVPEPQHCEEEEGGSMEQEHPGPSQVKKEKQESHRDFWTGHDAEQFKGLESDIKNFISSPSSLKAGLQVPTLPSHPYHHHNSEEGKEKRYSCSVCAKRFYHCSVLAAHIRIHTGERPYRCQICRKTFITTSALNRHQTLHTEGKPFVCVYCEKSFKWMESLGRHVRRVHKRENLPV